MRTISATRVLSLLAFLLLIAPFYDHCNGKFIGKDNSKSAEKKIDSTGSIQTQNTDSITKKVAVVVNDSIHVIEKDRIPFYESAYDFIDDPESENAFEIAGFAKIYFETPFKEFKINVQNGIQKRDFKGFFFHIKVISFLGIVVTTFLMLLLSFTDKKTILYKLSKLNLILLGLSIICTFLDGIFENFSQIKWGYYVFTLLQIVIFGVLYKNQNRLTK